MKAIVAVMTGAFSALTTLVIALYGTSCSLEDLFFYMALAYAAGISIVMFVPERKEENVNVRDQRKKA